MMAGEPKNLKNLPGNQKIEKHAFKVKCEKGGSFRRKIHNYYKTV
jgi:hypothetical protein